MNTDFPIPKYRKGDKVWFAQTTTKGARHDCPDCLGTKVWSCTSPAGETMTIDCPRCQQSYGNHEGLGLDYTKYVIYVRPLTIGSIKIDTDATGPYDEVVSYMCHETGVGSGSVYRESQLHDTEEKANAAAAVMAAEKQEGHDAEPEPMRRAKLALKPYFNAYTDTIREKVERDWIRKVESNMQELYGSGEYQPGQWRVHKEVWDTSNETFEISALQLDGSEVKVCTVRGSDAYSFYVNVSLLAGTCKLIAAAPALLTALKRVLNETVNGIAGPTPVTLALAQDAIALTAVNEET